MTNFIIRQMQAADRSAWIAMRLALWPPHSREEHAEWIEEILRSATAWGFMAESATGVPAGFAEIAVRAYANGCETRPVPFLEGIWVEPELRRQGIGKRLLAHAEAVLAARGFRELGSDSEIDNHASHAAHRSWGFSETERVVYFRKPLSR
jgi:aminoglycoside 6'-N-acetyltransferase I